MKKENFIFEDSSKHLVLRVVLFAAAFILAVYSFTKGVASIGHKEPGWQVVTAAADSENPLYGSGIDLRIYLEGSSSYIRRTLAQFTTEYSNALKHYYRLFDSVNFYENYTNLATLNSSLGKTVKVPQELFNVLSDAYNRTLSGQCNLFSGAQFNARQALENSIEYDAEYEAQRIERITDACNDLSNFSLVLNSVDCSVCFNVSPEFLSLMNELECPADYLNLNSMYYDYLISLLCSYLSDAGYDNFVFMAGGKVYEP